MYTVDLWRETVSWLLPRLALFLLLRALLVAQPSTPDLFALADRDLKAGNYDAALRQLAAIRCLASNGPLCPGRIASMAGTAHLFSGQYDQALTRFTESLAIYRAAKDRQRSIDLLNNIGTVHYYRGDYAQAHAAYRAAEAELPGVAGEAWFNSAAQFTAANMATLYQRLGRYRQALAVYQSLGKEPAGLTPPERAQFLSNLAVLNRRLGDPWKTRQLLQQALGLLNTSMHRDAWLGVVKNLGIVQALDFQDLPAAGDLFRQALQQAEKSGNAREAMQSRLYLAETQFRRGAFDSAISLWRATLEESRRLKTSEDEWRSLFGIARVQQRLGDRAAAWQSFSLAMERIEALRGGIASATLRSEFLADKMEVYEEALALLCERGDIASAFRTMERARALVLRESRGGSSGAVTLAQCQSRLAPGEMALLYHAGRSQSFLLWITRAQSGLRALPFSETQSASWLDQIRTDIDAAPVAKRALSAALLGPLPKLPASIQRLWVVPDGMLALLPFELLPFQNRPLIERFEVIYLPAAALLRSRPAPPDSLLWPWQKQLVAYADPDVAAAQLLPGDERWSPLPESGREAAALSSILPGRTALFTRTQTTPRKLLQAAKDVPMLHLATHGAGDPELAERNRLLIGPAYLYGSQLEPNSLRNLRLAVLSACQTETGPIRRGEGVQSLARSFLQAGAQATVASLWKVDDMATRLLMEEFYRRLVAREPVGAALRQAKLAFLHSSGRLRQPRYWAAFVVQGEGAEPIPRFFSWTELLITLALGAAFCAVAIFLFSTNRSAG